MSTPLIRPYDRHCQETNLLRVDPETGAIEVVAVFDAVSFGRFGEQGPVPNSGIIVRIVPGEISEEVLTGLSFPTSIDFNEGGDAFVTLLNGFADAGLGLVMRFEGLTSMAE